jgi:glycosyltransferase involved in cell wall biosynthesis
MQDSRPKTVLFHRDYTRFTGGQLKVWHYYGHVRESLSHEPRIYFTPTSRLDETNPWFQVKPPALAEWRPDDADVLFAAGMDWEAIPKTSDKPVVNLIQGTRHALPGDPRHVFLSRRAVRICVSEEVADALRATGRVNGPVFTIPNGIDHEMFPKAAAIRDIPLLIGGGKNPDMAGALERSLRERGLHVTTQIEQVNRADFLTLLGRAKVAVLLPFAMEGCYLPALEAMAMGALVVCPDCGGNRTFCLDRDNSFRPDYSFHAIEHAVLEACSLSQTDHEVMVSRGRRQAQDRSLDGERRLFLDVLRDLPSLV